MSEFMNLHPIRVIRDPIHGNINIYESEEAILNTKEFQRLRYISQLSLCSFVYPGATHNRFAHSLGAMHLAGEYYKSICQNSGLEFEKEIFLALRLAAMVHDIGHGPFSHVFERSIKFYFSKVKNDHKSFHHEDMSYKILKERLFDKIDSSVFDLVLKLISGKNLPSDKLFLSQIISSEIDADRSDFLLRDAFYSGVNYGQYEIKRLLETISLSQVNSKTVLTFKFKGLMALESFIFARYNMYRGVYFHHTNLIGDAMIARAMFYLLENELFPLESISDPVEFIKWNDHRLFGLFSDLIYSKSVLNRKNPNFVTIDGIINRNLWKRFNLPKNSSFETVISKIKEFSITNNIDQDFIFEDVNIEKTPYTWLPLQYDNEKPTNIYITDKNSEVVEFSSVSQITVPKDFLNYRQMLVHPDYFQSIQNLFK